MKILIGLHDSDAARAALEYVRMQNWPAGTQALLVAAHDPSAHSYVQTYDAPRETVEEVFDHDANTTRSFVAGAEHSLRNHGLRTTTRVLSGDPREAILDAAKDDHVDLIVVGGRERSAFDRMLHGSVAAYVVAHAPCNVMVVKQARSESDFAS